MAAIGNEWSRGAMLLCYGSVLCSGSSQGEMVLSSWLPEPVIQVSIHDLTALHLPSYLQLNTVVTGGLSKVPY